MTHQLENKFNILNRWFSTLQLLIPDTPYSEFHSIMIKLDRIKKEIETLILDDYIKINNI